MTVPRQLYFFRCFVSGRCPSSSVGLGFQDIPLIPLPRAFVLDVDDDQQIDGEDVAWEDDDVGEGDGGEPEGGESPVEFEVDDVDEEPEERRVRVLQTYTEKHNP